MSPKAHPGNQHAAKGKLYEGAVKRALARKFGSVDEGLNAVADQLVDDATNPEVDPAIREKARREIADRIDGKAKQQVEVAGNDGGPILMAAASLSDDQLASIASSAAKLTHDATASGE